MLEQKLEIINFTDGELSLEVNLSPEEETVWLTQKQMSELFQKDISTIREHIKNIYEEKELEENSTRGKFPQVQIEGDREIKRQIMQYNLDVIISVGYRVKSSRGVIFRKWASSVLKQYMLKGVVINQKRLDYLEQQVQVISILQRTTNSLEKKEILHVLEQYTQALTLLDDYDHQRIQKPKGQTKAYKLSYEECREFVDNMCFNEDSELFGKEKDGMFKSAIGAIHQTAFGKDVYPSLEEKAANLLYLLVKNHGFVDGNKRIAAGLFVFFLDKCGRLLKKDKLVIDNQTLVAITIMLAESRPEEKEIMVRLIMNFLV